MYNRAAKIITLTILGFFVLSLISLEHFQPQKVSNLEALIVQAQKLQQSSDSISADFNTVFCATINVLQQVAGLQTVVTTHSTTSGSKPVHFAVKIKSPFFLAVNNTLPARINFHSISFVPFNYHYKSYTDPPETPPPMPS